MALARARRRADLALRSYQPQKWRADTAGSRSDPATSIAILRVTPFAGLVQQLTRAPGTVEVRGLQLRFDLDRQRLRFCQPFDELLVEAIGGRRTTCFMEC